MMTKKDFVALAKALRAARIAVPAPSIQRIEGVKNCIDNAALVCAASNPNFDRARFLAACGVGDER